MILETITAGLQALAKVFGFASQEVDLKNATPVQTAKVAQSEVDQVAADTKAVADHDIPEMQKRTSE